MHSFALSSESAQDSALLRALGLAYHWQRLLDEQRVDTVAEIAEAEEINVTQVRRLYRCCHLQPAPRKPTWMLDAGSKARARQTEKTARREAFNLPELARSRVCRARGNGPEPRQHWRSGQKKSQPIRVGISNYGGGGGNRTRVRDLR